MTLRCCQHLQTSPGEGLVPAGTSLPTPGLQQQPNNIMAADADAQPLSCTTAHNIAATELSLTCLGATKTQRRCNAMQGRDTKLRFQRMYMRCHWCPSPTGEMNHPEVGKTHARACHQSADAELTHIVVHHHQQYAMCICGSKQPAPSASPNAHASQKAVVWGTCRCTHALEDYAFLPRST